MDVLPKSIFRSSVSACDQRVRKLLAGASTAMAKPSIRSICRATSTSAGERPTSSSLRVVARWQRSDVHAKP